MQALVASSSGAEHVELREVPEPTPAPSETLVQVHAVSLNRGEMHRLSLASDGTRFGWDFAGTVVQSSPDGAGLPVGTRVVGFVLGGAWAERVAVTNNRLAPLPDNVSYAQAATLPVAGLTALRTLRRGGLALRQHILVTGAAGGVGRFAVQLAALAGAEVTAVAASAERAEGLNQLGAHHVITDLADVHDSFDLILESVGGATLGWALEHTAPGGVVVNFGNSSREETSFNVSNFYSKDGVRLEGFLLLAPTQPQNFGEDLATLATLVSEGKIATPVDLEVSWREASRALAALRERRVRGKAVLRVE